LGASLLARTLGCVFKLSAHPLSVLVADNRDDAQEWLLLIRLTSELLSGLEQHTKG
jgi:hypothetical protein